MAAMMQCMQHMAAMTPDMQGMMPDMRGMMPDMQGMVPDMQGMMPDMQGMMGMMQGMPMVMGPWPVVMTQQSATRQDGQVTVTTWVRSRSDEPYGFEVRVPVPSGARMVTSWAGQPGIHPGSFDGQSIGWVNPGVAPGRTQGPFVVVIETGGAPLQTHSWIRFWGGRAPGAWTGPTLRVAGGQP